MSSGRAYFNAITSPSALLAYIREHKNEDTEHLRRSTSIDAPNDWDVTYLYKARVVCPKTVGPFLGIAGIEGEDNLEWQEVTAPFPGRLDGRPPGRYHQYFETGTAANYWEAYHELIGAPPSPPKNKRFPIGSPRTPRRATKKQCLPEGHVRSDQMRVDDSPPDKPESDSDDDLAAKNDSAFVWPSVHDKRSPPEDAAVNAIMAAVKHALTWHVPQRGCNLRDDVNQSPVDEKVMLSSSTVQHTAYGTIPSFRAGIEATSDGEILVHHPVDGKYANSRENVAAILEAKKRFRLSDIDGGRATIPDHVLAQVVGEALALRGTSLYYDEWGTFTLHFLVL